MLSNSVPALKLAKPEESSRAITPEQNKTFLSDHTRFRVVVKTLNCEKFKTKASTRS
jgi:hypothetical protein